jgi:outer membrane protein assembly factor BamB
MYRGGAARSGVYGDGSLPPGFRPWKSWVGGAVNSSPAVLGDVVYVTNSLGVSETSAASHYPAASATVHALDAVTGVRRWQAGLGRGVESSPAAASGMLHGGSGDGVYFGGDDGKVHALDARTGAQVWAYQTGDQPHRPQGRVRPGTFISSPAVAGGTVYIGGPDACILALNAAAGSLLWTCQTNAERLPGKPGSRPLAGDQRFPVMVTSSPAVIDGTVYVAGADLHAYALDAASGVPRWSRWVGGSGSSPAVAAGAVYIGGLGAVYALEAASGQPLWEHRRADEMSFSGHAPAVAGGTVYVAGHNYRRKDGVLLALDTETGAVRWQRHRPRGTHDTSPAVAGQSVYVACRGPARAGAYLLALDAATGAPRWRRRLRSPITLMSSPVIAGGVVYVGGSGGYLYALDAATGASPRWLAPWGRRAPTVP